MGWIICVTPRLAIQPGTLVTRECNEASVRNPESALVHQVHWWGAVRSIKSLDPLPIKQGGVCVCIYHVYIHINILYTHELKKEKKST